jgi:hypothetical protein
VNEKRFRFDLYVALLALLISGVAAAASAYQTYVIRQQFSATVWPYLTFSSTSFGGDSFELSVSNPGIGPALIRQAIVTRDGKPIVVALSPTSAPALSVAFEPERSAAVRDESKPGVHGKSDWTVTSIVRGEVVPAGSKLLLLRVDGRFLTRRILADMRRIDVQLCYCSLLGNCWTKRLWDPTSEPHAVGSCPDA